MSEVDPDDFMRGLDRLEGRLEARLVRIEAKVDITNGRMTSVERRHIEEDARSSERERLAEATASAAAEQTSKIFEDREWSLKKKLGVGGLVVGAISVGIPLMQALLLGLHSLTS